jgi:citrate lyase alpha subunit
VDVVITEEDAVVNPASHSPYVAALKDNASKAGIPLISMEALATKAMARAKGLGPLMPEPNLTGEAVEIIKADDGSILDVVRQVAPASS